MTKAQLERGPPPWVAIVQKTKNLLKEKILENPIIDYLIGVTQPKSGGEG